MKALKKNKNSDTFLIKLPTYSPLHILVRWLIIGTIGFVLMQFILFLYPVPEDRYPVPLSIYAWSILLFLVSSELQILFDQILEYFLPIPNKIRLRFGLERLSNILLLVFMLIAGNFIFPKQGSNGPFYFGIALSLLFLNNLSSYLIANRFTQRLLNSQRQLAKVQKEKHELSYNSLQDQLNPHFLFNNLSVLKSLIMFDKDAALAFTDNFTDVYRYVLKNKENKLISLHEEFNFIQSYYGLHKERVGQGIEVSLDIDDTLKDLLIAPMALQLLLENALKHNVANKKQPLSLHLCVKDGALSLSNNIQPRDSSYSTHTGLKNLIQRYELLTDEEVKVENDGRIFKVTIPLLK